MIGTFIDDHYRVDFDVGRGGVANVYGAYDIYQERTIALKILRDDVQDPAVRERFLLEAESLASLNTHHVPRLFEFGRDMQRRLLFIAMEIATGRDLSSMIAENTISVSLGLEIAEQVGCGLEKIHAIGLIHRDIKPANLKLSPVENGLLLKILDLGYAGFKDTNPGLTAEGMAPGTVSYMAPEMLRKEKPDARTDIYSLGAVLFEAFCGRPPFIGKTPLMTAKGHLEEPVPSLQALRPDLPEAIESLVRHMLSKDPADRPADGPALGRRIRELRRELGLPPFRVDGDSSSGRAG